MAKTPPRRRLLKSGGKRSHLSQERAQDIMRSDFDLNSLIIVWWISNSDRQKVDHGKLAVRLLDSIIRLKQPRRAPTYSAGDPQSSQSRITNHILKVAVERVRNPRLQHVGRG